MCENCGCHSHEEATITIPVSGMSCEHCKRAVEKALAELPGVFHVHVDLGQQNVSFNLSDDPAVKTDLAEIKAAIVDAGYEVN